MTRVTELMTKTTILTMLITTPDRIRTLPALLGPTLETIQTTLVTKTSSTTSSETTSSSPTKTTPSSTKAATASNSQRTSDSSTQKSLATGSASSASANRTSRSRLSRSSWRRTSAQCCTSSVSSKRTWRPKTSSDSQMRRRWPTSRSWTSATTKSSFKGLLYLLNSPNLSGLEVLVLDNCDIGCFEPRTSSLACSSAQRLKDKNKAASNWNTSQLSGWARDVRMNAYYYHNYVKKLRVLSLAQNNLRPWLRELMTLAIIFCLYISLH